MRYDLPNFRIDFTDWMKGNNLYDNYPSGGLKESALAYNPFKYPGLLVSAPDRVETTITSSLKRVPSFAWAISFSNKGTAGVSTDNAIVALSGDVPGTAGDGYFYEVNKSTGVFTSIVNDTVKDYVEGITFALPYNEGAIFTSTTDISYVIPRLNSVNKTLWTGAGDLNQSALTDSVPHPMSYLDDLIYIGDGGDLHEFDTGSFTADSNVFSLGNNFVITALAEHRGYLYIAASQYFFDFASFTTVKALSKIFLWDGFSEGYLDEFITPDRINAFKASEDGRLYGWTTKQFGYFNGLSFTPLKDLENAVYPHHIVSVKNGLMYADGTKIIRYSSIYPGSTRRFFFIEQHTKTIGSIMISYLTNYIVTLNGAVSTSGVNLLYSDLDNRSGGTRSYEFNPREIKVPVKVRSVVIETDGLGSPGSVQVQFKNENGVTQSCGTFISSNTKMAAKKKWRFDPSKLTASSVIIPYITITGSAKLKSVDFFYEPAIDVGNA